MSNCARFSRGRGRSVGLDSVGRVVEYPGRSTVESRIVASTVPIGKPKESPIDEKFRDLLIVGTRGETTFVIALHVGQFFRSHSWFCAPCFDDR